MQKIDFLSQNTRNIEIFEYFLETLSLGTWMNAKRIFELLILMHTVHAFKIRSTKRYLLQFYNNVDYCLLPRSVFPP